MYDKSENLKKEISELEKFQEQGMSYVALQFQSHDEFFNSIMSDMERISKSRSTMELLLLQREIKALFNREITDRMEKIKNEINRDFEKQKELEQIWKENNQLEQ